MCYDFKLHTSCVWISKVSICVGISNLQLLKNKQGNDRFAERGMNTFNEPQKCKLVQTSKIGYNVSGFLPSHSSQNAK